MWNETNILSYEDFDSISDWAIPSLQWAVGAGVMKGRTDSTINPIENITRAEIAQMLVNYMGAVENYKNEINKED
ncbi:MAG: S-layer homology domain-containing protein [Clostridia bacterium]|nr:S-layer homology domain-containing protein [Clostridia bacterium]